MELIDKTARSGTQCSFYIRNGIGYKIYTSEMVAKYAFLKQETAYKFNLAPKPLKMIKNGYTTEVAIPLDEVYGIDFPENLTNKKVKKEISILCNKYYNLFEDHYDDHLGNFGYYNDNIVLLDFGTY